MVLAAKEGGMTTFENPAYQVTKLTWRFQEESGDGSGTCITTPVGCMQEENLDPLYATTITSL